MSEQDAYAVIDGPFLTTKEAARFLKLKPCLAPLDCATDLAFL